MKGRAIALISGGIAVVGIAAATALALSPADRHYLADSASTGLASSRMETIADDNARGTDTTAGPISAASVVAPRIPREYAGQADFIRSHWADGANLSEHYVQMTVPCGRDCFALIIGNLRSGEIYDSGMGHSAMPDLGAESRADSDLLLLSWMNLAGGNCMRAVYRWDGQNLGGVSDVLEYDYTDAGCAQFQLEDAMSDLD